MTIEQIKQKLDDELDDILSAKVLPKFLLFRVWNGDKLHTTDIINYGVSERELIYIEVEGKDYYNIIKFNITETHGQITQQEQ